MNNKCVYVYLDHRKPGKYIYEDLKLDYEPIYVGKGNLDRPDKHRYSYKYINRYNNKYKCLFYTKIISIINETGIFPSYIIYKNELTYDEANNIEISLIKRIGRIQNGGILTNMTDGGDGQGEYYIPSEETKRKMSIIMTGRKFGPMLEETKIKISKSKKDKCDGEKNPNWGKKMSEYCKKKIIEKNKRTYELIDKNGKKTIIDNMKNYCLNNNISYGCMLNLISGHSKKYKNWIKVIKIKKPD